MKFIEFINEAKSPAEIIETIACIGIVLNSVAMKSINIISELNTIKDFKDDPIQYEKAATSALKHMQAAVAVKRNYDWNSKGVSYVESVKDDDWKTIMYMCKIVRGMYDFVQDKIIPVIPNPSFIHNNIKNYRKVEQKSFGKVQGEKSNVADVIIINTDSIPDLFQSIKESGITSYPERDRGYVVTGPYIYFQVSLKKSDMSQAGKVTITARDLGLVPSDIKKYIDPVLNRVAKIDDSVSEGIFDMLKDTWSWLIGKIKPMIQQLKSEVVSAFYPTPNKRDFMEVLSFYKDESVHESKGESLFTSQSGKDITDPIAQKAITAISNNPNIMVNEINRKLDVATKKAKKSDVVFLVNKLSSLNKLTGDAGNIIQTCYALVCNYITAEFIINFIGTADEMSNNIKRLLAGMKYGSTKLPVWKVYGYGTKYEYLGTYDIYIKDLPDFTIDPFGVNAYPNTRRKYGFNEYYVFVMLMINNLTDKEKEYLLLRSGSYSSSRISYAIEGTSIQGPYPLNKKMEDMLLKVKD
ncbi:hypothetical protein M0R04_16440 [Candidatus Dojkabacteria bacterium]|jgi:hypothetical protein|nr:hypothetical protein [Candidatus Dojkabacteria bacterium]